MITLDRNIYASVTFSGGTDETKTEALSLAGDENLVYYVSNHTATAGADVWPAPAVEVPATCTEAGSVTYTGLLTDETHVTVIPALGHSLVSHAAVAPTCGANGNIAYWQCSVCNKYFSDEAAENEITEAETVDPATGAHTFGEFTANNDKTQPRGIF